MSIFEAHYFLISLITSEDIASLSQEVISLHESLIPAPRWKRYGTIVDRIVTLVQCLRTLAQAQKNEELSRTTRLICGYLCFIDSWDRDTSILEDRLSDKHTWKCIIGELLHSLIFRTSVT